jgi:putative ABC transport system substrate-binding protein
MSLSLSHHLTQPSRFDILTTLGFACGHRMQFDHLKRREFITLLGGGAAWPLAARAQQPNRMRRIGALLSFSADDTESLAVVGAFSQGLQELGWKLGSNIRIEYRWGAVDDDAMRKLAADVVALAPDVILASGGTAVRALQRATTSLPIVFANTGDPVGGGLVASLGRPEGNATGFLSVEYGISAKWLELLKQIAPNLKKVAVLRDPTAGSGLGQFGAIMAAATSLGAEVSPVDARDIKGIERAIVSLSRSNGGLIITTSRHARIHRASIITLAAQHKLPTIYPHRSYVTSGGLISYGPDYIEQFRQAAGYVDRILKGEKPADLPVQAPTKYELVINLKTAKALSLEIPPALLISADEVIE